MGVLLQRARKVFGGGPEVLPPAEPYDIACLCGEHVRGYRRDHRQFVPCPGCGQLHLVLPLSSYPRPIVYDSPVGLEHVPVEVVRPLRPFGLRLRIRMRRMRRASIRAAWLLVPPARWFSPVRLVIMAILLVVSGTIWLALYQNQQARLTSDIVSLREEWTRDMEQADFAAARTKLEQAAAAIRRYGSQSRDSREIQQLANEVAQFADLLDRPLDEVVRERRSMSATEADLYIRETLKHPALLLDVFVSPTAGTGSGSTGYRIDALIVTGPEPVRIDVSNLKLITALAPTTPTRLVFAARIEAIELLPNTGEWVIRFAPDSGLLVTSARCLEKLGWPLDEPTRSLLETQSKWTLDERSTSE